MKPLSRLLVLSLIPFLPTASSSETDTLYQGLSLSAPGDVLVSSPTPIFTAGFFRVGENAYCFAIWFTKPSNDGNLTVVWMANRDKPVNGRNTKLTLLDSGNLVLTDAGRIITWSSDTESKSSVHLKLHDSGNLVLRSDDGVTNIWQSFESPSNTLLPQQPFTRNSTLISSRSLTDHSSGFYKLYFDYDNVLSLLYERAQIASVFWPPSWLKSWEAGRSPYNGSKIAKLDLLGRFVSSDEFKFNTSDLGIGPQRRMILEPDGALRVYSLSKHEAWEVTWQMDLQPCRIHGICGANSLCTYSPELGRRCSCLPGHKMENRRDWSEGCVPDFKPLPCNDTDSAGFLPLHHVEFYGNDIGYFPNVTREKCESLCLSNCDCKGFQYTFKNETGFYSCFPKTLLLNGYQSVGFRDWTYILLPKHVLTSDQRSLRKFDLQCTSNVTQLQRAYNKKERYAWWKSLAWCAGVFGAIEAFCLFVFLYKTSRSRGSNVNDRGNYLQVASRFKRFTYAELKKATQNFREEVGRGGSGVVYKGKLSDERIAAIKRLNEAKQGEAEFLAEAGTIGRLNHANLIELWGYCAEGKHRLLVYEYLEHRSLVENLCSNNLDWRKRFDIALGTAKGLAYLHEECLEWVLHCDVKPQNILLDSNYKPKVADFGLSQQLKRSETENLNVSTIRGTRGYMAPEWVFNLPITSKVDVYSYGIVVLEMVTGKSPKELNVDGGSGRMEHKRLQNWVREMMQKGAEEGISWIEQIVDPRLGGEYDEDKLENLVRVALHCALDNKDSRPTMKQVVDMLLDQEA